MYYNRISYFYLQPTKPNIMEFNKVEINYGIEQKINGMLIISTPKDALAKCEATLKEYESYWSYCSSDCLGHGITCLQLLVNRLKIIVNH